MQSRSGRSGAAAELTVPNLIPGDRNVAEAITRPKAAER
jgi:hypothetical protein